MRRIAILAASSLVFAPAILPAQFCPEVRYGDPVVTGSITAANQIRCYTLKGGRKDEIVVASLASGNHFAYWSLKQGATVVRTLVGTEIATFKLPADDDYRLEVGARDSHSQSWYQFQIDRLTDPVRTMRICYGWNVRGSIDTQSQFVLYRFGAQAAKRATLGIASGNHFGFATVYGPDGSALATATGTAIVPCDFKTNGLHTMLVAARDLHSQSWYAVDVRCQTWPCESVADWGNFGDGWPGTGNVIPRLVLDRQPRLGQTVNLEMGNTSGATAAAVVLVGVDWHFEKTAFDGFLHLVPAAVIPVSLPASGLKVPIYLQNDASWKGLGLIFQSVQLDAAASKGHAFSRGLRVILGQ